MWLQRVLLISSIVYKPVGMVMFNCCCWTNAKFRNMNTLLNQHVVGKLSQILLNKRIMRFEEMVIIQIKWISINLKETDVIMARYAGLLLRQLPFNYSLHMKFWRQQKSIKLINNDIVNQKNKFTQKTLEKRWRENCRRSKS